MSPLPPLGTMTSTCESMAMSIPTAARSLVPTTCTASRGSPAAASPSWMHPAIARFDASASEPPRRMVALPDFRHSPAASAVTLGRDS